MFGFPQYSRPKNFHFNTNFLRSVAIQIKYPKRNIIEHKARLSALLSEKFPNVQELQSGSIQIKNVNNKTQFLTKDSGVSGVLFQTKDNLKSINFSDDFIVLNIDGNAYKNLEEYLKEIENEFFKALEICCIKELDWISIRKINLIQFGLEEGINPLEGISSVFNKALISNFLAIPGNEFLYNGISNISLKNDAHQLNLTLGLIPSFDKIKNLLLDIDLISSSERQQVSHLKEKLFEMNQEVFNIFNWSLQDKTIEQLRK